MESGTKFVKLTGFCKHIVNVACSQSPPFIPEDTKYTFTLFSILKLFTLSELAHDIDSQLVVYLLQVISEEQETVELSEKIDMLSLVLFACREIPEFVDVIHTCTDAIIRIISKCQTQNDVSRFCNCMQNLLLYDLESYDFVLIVIDELIGKCPDFIQVNHMLNIIKTLIEKEPEAKNDISEQLVQFLINCLIKFIESQEEEEEGDYFEEMTENQVIVNLCILRIKILIEGSIRNCMLFLNYGLITQVSRVISNTQESTRYVCELLKTIDDAILENKEQSSLQPVDLVSVLFSEDIISNMLDVSQNGKHDDSILATMYLASLFEIADDEQIYVITCETGVIERIIDYVQLEDPIITNAVCRSLACLILKPGLESLIEIYSALLISSDFLNSISECSNSNPNLSPIDQQCIETVLNYIYSIIE